MAVFFTESARDHFAEDRITEENVLRGIRRPLWATPIEPDDPAIPPTQVKVPPRYILLIIKRHPYSESNDLLEVLATKRDGNIQIFHVMHLSDKWKNYWLAYDPTAANQLGYPKKGN